MRTLLLCCLCLAATACFAQSTLAPSVVVGQDAQGRDEIVTVIPLKFLDPGYAAEVLAALGFTGAIVPINPAHNPGEFSGAYQGPGANRGARTHGDGSPYSRSNSGAQGYDGYQGALERNQQQPGYQSPYSHR